MIYPDIVTGTFLSRPNRFLAHVQIGRETVVCHVKNTGRLKELLLPGVPAAVQFHPDAAAHGRKTEYSLIAVAKPSPKGLSWVNIDSQAPNTAAYEWLTQGEGLPFCPRPKDVRREVRYGNSRFDLAFSDGGAQWYMEVKGVTLEADGVALFPDAPTERGVKHLHELGEAAKNGCQAALLFVIQMEGCRAFSPNRAAHPEFADALAAAGEKGVHIWARNCIVTENSMELDGPVPVVLS